jgi:preprotein translocase subunit SecY
MKKLFTTLSNIWKIEDLRARILFTLLCLLIYRIGSFIVLPGVNPASLDSQEKEGLLGLLNMFAGGSFSRASIFALGVMPYISASIVMQLLGIVVPYFQKLQKDGETGRKTINQLTRYLTIILTALQATAYVSSQIAADAKIMSEPLFTISSMFILTAGTLFVMWLGE